MRKVFDIVRLLAVLVILTHLGYRWFHNSAHPRVAEAKLLDSPELNLRSSRQTLVLITASYCKFCLESMPFYSQMVPIARRSGTRVVAATGEDTDINKLYLLSHDVSVDAVVPAQEIGTPVEVTPTLLLVRPDGTVAKSWRGELTARGQSELLDYLR